ncbi:hypothetical protein KQH89_07145, partial [Vibrio cholerae]|nr:hypothetical protein [Vibrio cholerae]
DPLLACVPAERRSTLIAQAEAAKVGFGASGRNGGQIVNSYSRDIDVIERSVGPQQAQLLGQMAFEGGRSIRERV